MSARGLPSVCGGDGGGGGYRLHQWPLRQSRQSSSLVHLAEESGVCLESKFIHQFGTKSTLTNRCHAKHAPDHQSVISRSSFTRSIYHYRILLKLHFPTSFEMACLLNQCLDSSNVSADCILDCNPTPGMPIVCNQNLPS